MPRIFEYHTPGMQGEFDAADARQRIYSRTLCNFSLISIASVVVLMQLNLIIAIGFGLGAVALALLAVIRGIICLRDHGMSAIVLGCVALNLSISLPVIAAVNILS